MRRMRDSFFGAIAGGLAALLVPSVRCSPLGRPVFSQVVAFGDSLSDNGNGSYLLSNKTWPANKAYFDGRFSNGPTWVEWIANDLSHGKIDDRAFGGATVNNTRIQGFTGPGSTIPVPSVTEVAEKFIADKQGHLDSKALYVVSGGANDAFFAAYIPGSDPVELAKATAKDLHYTIDKLNAAGAKTFLVPSAPSLSTTPFGLHYSNPGNMSYLRAFSDAFADAVQSQSALFSSAHRNDGKAHAHVAYWNQEKTTQVIAKHAKALGFTNVVDACLSGAYAEVPNETLCAEPDKFVFWDIYHPSRKTHRYLAKAAEVALGLSYLKPNL